MDKKIKTIIEAEKDNCHIKQGGVCPCCGGEKEPEYCEDCLNPLVVTAQKRYRDGGKKAAQEILSKMRQTYDNEYALTAEQYHAIKSKYMEDKDERTGS